MLRFSPAPPTERGQYAPDFYTAFSTLGGQHLPDCHEKLTGKSVKYSVNFTGGGGSAWSVISSKYPTVVQYRIELLP
jgi:hypothetical protein